MQKYGYNLMSSTFGYFILLYLLIYKPLEILALGYNPTWFIRLGDSIAHYKYRVIGVFFVNLGIIFLKMLQFKKHKLLKRFLNRYGTFACLGAFIYPFFSGWVFGHKNGTDIYAIMGSLFIMLRGITISIDRNTFKVRGEDKMEVKEAIEEGLELPSLTKDYFITAYGLFCWHLFLFVLFIFWIDIIGLVEEGCVNTLVEPAFCLLLFLIGLSVLYIGYRYLKDKKYLKNNSTEFFNRFNKGKKLNGKLTNSKSKRSNEGIFKNSDETTEGFWERMMDDYKTNGKKEYNKKGEEYINIKETKNDNTSKSHNASKSNLIVVDNKLTGEEIKSVTKKGLKKDVKSDEVHDDSYWLDLKKKFLKREKDRLEKKAEGFKKNIIIISSMPSVIGVVLAVILLINKIDFDYIITLCTIIGVILLTCYIAGYIWLDYKSDMSFLTHIKNGTIIQLDTKIVKFVSHYKVLNNTKENHESFSPYEIYTYTMVLSDGKHEFKSGEIPYSHCHNIVYDDKNEVLDNIKRFFTSISNPKSITLSGKEYKIGDKIMLLVNPDDWHYYRIDFPYN